MEAVMKNNFTFGLVNRNLAPAKESAFEKALTSLEVMLKDTAVHCPKLLQRLKQWRAAS